LKPGYALVNEAGYRIRNQLFCRCNGLDCEWEGQAYDGKCRDYDEYRLNIQKEVNHVVMKKYFKAAAVPVNLKIAKFAGGSNSKRVKKKVKKLKRLGKAAKRSTACRQRSLEVRNKVDTMNCSLEKSKRKFQKLMMKLANLSMKENEIIIQQWLWIFQSMCLT